MAGIKISDLPSAPSAQLTDVFPVDQGATTYKESNSQLFSLFKESGGAFSKTTFVNSTSYNVLTTDNIILVDTASIAAPVSIVLPASPPTDGQVWTIKDIGNDASTYNITVSVSGGGNIDGNSDYIINNDLAAASFAWSSSESAYVAVYDYNTFVYVLGVTGTANRIVVTGPRFSPVVDIASTYVGQTSLTTLGTIGTGTWQGTVIGGTYGGTGVNNGANTATYAGNLNFASSFTTSGAFSVTQTYTGITSVTFPTSGTLATTSQLPTPAALTKVDDTNVTLTLGGTPATALLQATSITAGWTGTLSGTRGGTGVNNGASTITLGGSLTTSGAFASTFTMTGITTVTFPTSGTLATTSQIPTGAALTKTDDTNVTLTLGGSPTTALVNAASLTLGWTGQLGVSRGGTGASSVGANGTLAQSNGSIYTFTTATYPSVATSTGKILRADGTNWAASTATFADTYTASNILYSNGANTVTGLATANNGILVTSSGGVPSIGNTVGAGLTMPSITFNTTTGIVGTTTNNDAAAGSVGEFVSSVIAAASAVSVSTGTIKDITSISLTAGDWDVWGNVVFLFPASTNYTALLSWISSTSVTQPDASLISDLSTGAGGAVPGGGSAISVVPLMRRFSLSGTTTIYLSSQQVFTVSTLTACGGIYARRVR
jgi:hypothetical protein